jgi:hypothetical protein
MEAFLQLLGAKSIDVGSLLEKRYPVDEGDKAYADLRSSGAYTILIEYPGCSTERPFNAPLPAPQPLRRSTRSGDLTIGCIGAGSFGRNVIFPVLRNFKGMVLGSVATASGIAAQSACNSFGVANAQTPANLVPGRDTDAVRPVCGGCIDESQTRVC